MLAGNPNIRQVDPCFMFLRFLSGTLPYNMDTGCRIAGKKFRRVIFQLPAVNLIRCKNRIHHLINVTEGKQIYPAVFFQILPIFLQNRINIIPVQPANRIYIITGYFSPVKAGLRSVDRDRDKAAVRCKDQFPVIRHKTVFHIVGTFFYEFPVHQMIGLRADGIHIFQDLALAVYFAVLSCASGEGGKKKGCQKKKSKRFRVCFHV